MAYCPSCGFEGTPTKGYCPQCKSKMKPGSPKKPIKREPSKGRAMAGRVAYWAIIAVILILVLGMLFIPQMEKVRNSFYDAFLTGINHYKEVPDYAEFELERTLTISVPQDIDWVEYTLRMQQPVDLYMRERIGSSEARTENLYQEVLSIERDTSVGSNGAQPPVILAKTQLNLDENGEEFSQIINVFTNSEDTVDTYLTTFAKSTEVVSDNSRPSQLTSGQSQTITITYHIRSYSVEWSVNSAVSGTVDDIPQEYMDAYVSRPTEAGVEPNGDQWRIVDDADQPTYIEYPTYDPVEWRIQPSHPAIQELTGQLTAGMDNVYDKVKAIYDYLDDTLTYKTLATGEPPKACVQTLADKEGDCDDQSILFISLCRAAGIPAWLVGGVLYDPLTGEWVGHGWAQCLIPLDDGSFVTPTVDVVNDHFLFRDPNRLTDYVDPGEVGYYDNINNEWKDGSLGRYYSSWTYSYDGSGSSVDITDGYDAISSKAESSGITITI